MMQPVEKELTEAQRKALAFLTRRIQFEPPSAETLAKREKEEREELLRNLQPGDKMEDGSVYIGQYSPIDRAGNRLGKIFNAFAAPEDLPGTMTYVDAGKRISELQNWYGHDGTSYATDKEIYTALKDGSYNGGWIIPPRELLAGTEPDGPTGIRQGTIIQSDNLFDHKDKGALKDTFKTAAASGSGYPVWYWSSTEDRDYSSFVLVVRFSDGDDDWDLKGITRLSCRPVRLVAASAPAPAPV